MDKVQHFEIGALDMKRAGKFYKDVFGWKVTDLSMENIEYHSLRNTPVGKDNMPKEVGVINGGLMPKMGSESVMIVITVDDIDKSVKKAVKNGAREVMKKMKVGDMGYYSRILDTESNLIGLWENQEKKK